MARVLGATRLSRDTDASTSVERQTEQITYTARARGDEVVKITEDVDVSGKVSPFERADLGPWLTEPGKIAQWDVLIVAKLDRLTRNLRHFDDLRMWCDAHSKTIVSVSESLDLSTSVGRMFANLLAMFSQFERERMSERRQDAARKLRTMGAWGGGRAPYGYDAVKNGSQYFLVLNDAQAAVLREMCGMVVGGTSARQIAVTLNGRGVASPDGARWNSGSVLTVLRNEVIRGVVTHDGKPVMGEDGMAVRMPDAVIDDLTWHKVQRKINGDRQPGKRVQYGAGMLYGVLSCGCGSSLHIKRRDRGNQYRHNDLSECRNTYSAKMIENAVSDELLALVGHVMRTERILIPGENHDTEIARIEESVATIEDQVLSGDVPATAVTGLLSKLQSKLDSLRALPSTADEWDDRPTGATYAQHWAGLDDAGRGEFLRSLDVRVTVSRGLTIPDMEFARVTELVDVPRVSIVNTGLASVVINWGALRPIIDRAKSL